jgi:hypothetical protein
MEHRDHRDHQSPMPPMPPMPNGGSQTVLGAADDADEAGAGLPWREMV